ncbi:RING-H2 finger protein ATL2-like [Phragmites australis]|uniref:RING-H2 finger protein ATL2-like n=1 Tax=Phragmites australis TaxID=29695 RepID=UPI002D79BE1B|nr:RING-H2 finger protein ATL2-like [Phragmites australis]
MLGSGLNLVTTVIGFGMSATFIVFVCARLICGRAARADADADAVVVAAARALAQPPAPFDFDIEFRTADLNRTIEHSRSGLDPFVVAAIPTMNYSCEAFHSKDDAQCSICLGEYKEKEILRIMPTCQHNFHLECIDVWLQKQTTCPICRISLKDLPGAKATASPLRSLPQLLGRSESPVNRSPHWILPIHRDSTGGRQNNPASQESLEMIIEMQPQR